MVSDKFNNRNNFLAWSCFTVALIVYSLTAEPTVSFWDSGEYILTSAKLQVGHPPGAPLYQMLGAVFSSIALEQNQVGYVMNLMSGVASAFTILFMFFSTSILLQKITSKINNKKNQDFLILLSSSIASLTFTFTDTFWFNAVETEVYAMATLIMSLLFYLGLRWELEMNQPRGNRWLILISFVVGLSFGVHFMGLLTIPAIGLIYFFKNYKPITIKKFIIANIAVVSVLLIVFKLLAPNILRYFSILEVFFVNSIGLPFNSGTIIAGILLVCFFYYFLSYTVKNNLKTLNTITLCIMFILIGFSSWIMLPIRANANVVVNENDPSNARELLAYYNLEQYPKTYLFYGPLFSDQYSGLDEENRYKDDKPKYEKDLVNNKYVIVNNFKNASQNFNSSQASLLPRMWSPAHAENYLRYSGFLEFDLKREYKNTQEYNQLIEMVNDFKNKTNNGEISLEDHHRFLKTYGPEYLDIKKPSLFSNIKYLFQYQLGYMYWRYFMWNFSGRQDDIQGRMDMHGNWISGIDFIDEIHLGISQENLPSDVLKNKARNKYYMIPFLIGLIGLYFLFKKNRELFWTMLVFFLFTGLAIQVYTNVRPFEPRERDYSVVGSFYVYSIWIGFGVYSILQYLKNYLTSKRIKTLISIIFITILPINLASSNWDDHDRSGKYTAYSMALKYLESCEPNSILFTIGDNDTFPLWYLQEVEGIRTDVRVLNTSLFATDWYINQMKRKAYNSEPIPSSISSDKYKFGSRDYIIKEITTRDTINLKTILNEITSDSLKWKNYKILKIDFIKEEVIKNKFYELVEDYNSNKLKINEWEDPNEILLNMANDFYLEKEEEITALIENNVNSQVEGWQDYKNNMLKEEIWTEQYLNTNYLRTENIRIDVDKESVIKNNVVSENLHDSIVDEIVIKIKDQALYKNRLMMLDIIANNNWERPIYFTGGSFGDDDYLWMKEYLQLEGLCYKLVPVKTPVDKSNPYELGRVNTEKMYSMVKKWDWGTDNMDVYFDVETRRNSITYRNNIARLISELINENNTAKAEEITDLVMENLPVDVYGYYSLLDPYISSYYVLGKKEKARNLFKEISTKYKENLFYFSEVSDLNKIKYFQEIATEIHKYEKLFDIIIEYDDNEEFLINELNEFKSYLGLFEEILASE